MIQHIHKISLCMLGLLCLAVTLSRPVSANQLTQGDFNGDGYADLAVGVPDEDVTTSGIVQITRIDAGAVNILYGSSARLRSTAATDLTGRNDQLWHRERINIDGIVVDHELFGYAVAVGDFNNDGYHDLAVGVPGQTVGQIVAANAGAVHIIYGSSAGLSATRLANGTGRSDQIWHRDSVGVRGTPKEDDFFGSSLTTGDFNGDRYDDLAIGVPFADVAIDGVTKTDAGAVHILYGSADGLSAHVATDGSGRDDQLWDQGRQDLPDDGILDDVKGAAEDGNRFGWSLAAGDFDCNGYDDLVIGVPFEEVGPDIDAGVLAAGAVNVLEGAESGLALFGNEIWHQATDELAGLPDMGEENDHFGWSLAVGDFNNNGCDDLAMGVPGEDITRDGVAKTDAGAVVVIYGVECCGLNYGDKKFWSQDTEGIEEMSDTGDQFGYVLAAGDMNGDTYDDLAVGVPFEDFDVGVAIILDVGVVNVLFGSEVSGLASGGDQFWHQNSVDAGGFVISDSSEDGDIFGSSLTIGDFNNNSFADLAIGVPFEDIRTSNITTADTGGVNVLYGPLSGADDQFWHQNSSGVDDLNEHYDHFSGTILE